MLRQGLSFKLQQKLSPQQIQLMKLLQLPTTAMEQRIQEELEANPVLETGDDYEEDNFSNAELSDSDNMSDDDNFGDESEDFRDEEEIPLREESYELDEYLERYMEDDPSSYKVRGEGNSPDEEEKVIPVAVESSFHEYLETQLGLLDLKDMRQEMIAKQIIGSIDEDGYLRRDVESIVDDLLFQHNINTEVREVNNILEKIQRFDPPGVGARDLRECLLIQIRQKIEVEDLCDEDIKRLRLAARILIEQFDEFAKKHYPKLQRQLNLSEEQLKAALDEIIKLNPKPASGHVNVSERNMQYIVPDFLIENRDGRLELAVDSRNLPDLRISDHYRDMLQAYKKGRGKHSDRLQKEAIMFIKQKIDSAKWFIDAIRQREQTMFKTMYAIMQYQYEYFLTGDAKRIKPMILKDIADITELDISTVSRVANSKYVQTEFGTKRLKDFFSESLQTSEGEEVSTLEVKKILTDIIGTESKRKPLSDEKLKSMLLKKGYNIARRTVAKYREQLNIPVARLRKEL